MSARGVGGSLATTLVAQAGSAWSPRCSPTPGGTTRGSHAPQDIRTSSSRIAQGGARVLGRGAS